MSRIGLVSMLLLPLVCVVVRVVTSSFIVSSSLFLVCELHSVVPGSLSFAVRHLLVHMKVVGYL